MWFMDITVSKPGTQVEAVEALLLEVFQRYEKAEVFTVDKPTHARVGMSYAAYRYRVHIPTAFDVKGTIESLIERLKVRTVGDIHITHPQSFAIFTVDRKRAVD